MKSNLLKFSVKTGPNTSDVSIRYSVVQSPCGNVVHTLINTKEYKSKEGLSFLPGFVDVDDKGKKQNLLVKLLAYLC